jgi:hypothetical protein
MEIAKIMTLDQYKYIPNELRIEIISYLPVKTCPMCYKKHISHIKVFCCVPCRLGACSIVMFYFTKYTIIVLSYHTFRIVYNICILTSLLTYYVLVILHFLISIIFYFLFATRFIMVIFHQYLIQ